MHLLLRELRGSLSGRVLLCERCIARVGRVGGHGPLQRACFACSVSSTATTPVATTPVASTAAIAAASYIMPCEDHEQPSIWVCCALVM